MIKEVKQWFVRLGAVVVGQLRDRETTFKKQYPSTAGDLAGEYMMFLKENFPSENVYKKLFDSIAFILNTEDTAFEKQQGLVQKATDAKAILRDSRDSAGLDGLGGGGISQDTETIINGVKYLSSTNFATAVLPHQLPNLHCLSIDPDGAKATPVVEESNGIIIEGYTITLTGSHAGRTRKNFTIKANVDNVSTEINSNKIATIGLTQTLTVVTGVIYNDGTGLVSSVTTANLNIVNGLIQSIT